MLTTKYILISLLIPALLSGVAFASGNDFDPAITPTNPLYFLKEWGRSIKLFFTFSPTAKAELELKILNQKAAEIIKVKKLRPDDLEAIEDAFASYQESQKAVVARINKLKGSSATSAFLNDFISQAADVSTKHFKNFKSALVDLDNLVGASQLVRSSLEGASDLVVSAYQKLPEVFEEFDKLSDKLNILE
ncbi:MAG: DUF5667 domain-containing protein [bacterium]|nr:DUF5667 domain-containing protein [bacterium]